VCGSVCWVSRQGAPAVSVGQQLAGWQQVVSSMWLDAWWRQWVVSMLTHTHAGPVVCGCSDGLNQK
jgi:hypothetical protein